MRFISTKYNGFCHTVCAFEIVGYFLCYFPMAIFNHDVIIIVTVVVYSIFDFIAVNILLTFDWSPLIPDVCCNIYDFKWSKESIFYTVFSDYMCKQVRQSIQCLIDIVFLLGVAVMPMCVAEEK